MPNWRLPIFGLFSLLSACGELGGSRCSDMHHDSLDPSEITQIRVYDTRGAETVERLLVAINQRTDIDAVFTFLHQRRDRWHASAFGVPVGRYRVVFFEDDERVGAVSLGEGFLVVQGCGYFFSKNLSQPEMGEFLELVELGAPIEF